VTVVVRSTTEDEAEMVVARRIEFLGAVRGPSFRPSHDLVERTHSWVAAEQRAGRLHSWVAEDGPEFVGVVSLLLWPRPPQPEDIRTLEGYIINMYVPPTRRRLGIGRRLLAHCRAGAEQLGVRKLLLHATEEARPLYESSGFAPKMNWMELPVGHRTRPGRRDEPSNVDRTPTSGAGR
jgi:GNAT superfamily N-acetyltransferase